jgi:aminoglycoside phosphotransferase family enzyme
VIETVLSKLFLRGDEVHKAYKHRSADFADLTDKETRRRYISEDFFWNNVMAPEIYLELRHVLKDDDRFVHVEPEEAEDWYIVMRKIDTERDLLKRLRDEHPSDEELASYARTLTTRLRALTEARGSDLRSHLDRSTAHVRDEILGVLDWARTAAPHLSQGDIDRAQLLLTRTFEEVSYFKNDIDLSVVIDNNPENIVFIGGDASFIDVMPPKDSWRVHDPYFSICRTSADICALGIPESAETLHEEYRLHRELPPPVVRHAYELAAALIQTPYRKMVERPELADRYAEFSRKKMDGLEKALDSLTD